MARTGPAKASVARVVNTKKLRIALSAVNSFKDPNIELEQYMTQPEVCSHVMTQAARLGDIVGRDICDLGCGTGMLAIAADLCGASRVVGFDIDATALAIAETNCEALGCEAVEFLQCDVTHIPVRTFSAQAQAARADGASALSTPAQGTEGASGDPCMDASTFAGSSSVPASGSAPGLASVGFDTVLTNPPFGTRNAGADMRFLAAAIALVKPGGVVYSMHKTSTRDHVIRTATDTLGATEAKVVAELRFDLPKSYAFHAKASSDVAVDLVRLIR